MMKKQTLLLCVGLLSIILVVYHIWFFSFGILTSGDWLFFYPETQQYYFHNVFSLWNSLTTFGRVALEIGQAPVIYLFGLFHHLFGASYALNERLIYFWPIALVTPFASFLLLRKLFRNNTAIGIGVLFYSFNTYFLAIQTGHMTLMAAFSFAPLILLSYMKTLEQKKMIWVVVTSLLLYLGSIYEPRGVLIISAVLFLYAMYHYIVQETEITKKNIVRFIIFASLPVILLGFMVFHWVIALANIGVIASNELFTRVIYGNEFMSIFNAFTLFHPFWTGGALKIATSQPIMPQFWITPFLAILGVMLFKEKKYLVFFALLSCLGIFLTKQSDIPFSQFYSWMYANFPGFNAFREASKFFSLTAIGYSVLITAFFSWLLDRKSKASWQLPATYIFIALYVFFILWNTKPLVTGEMGTLFQSRTTPKDFLVVRDYLLRQNEYSRTLWVPVSSRWSVQTENHPQLSMAHRTDTEWRKYLSGENTDIYLRNDIVELIRHPSFENLLTLSSIKYLIVSTRHKDSEEDWVGPSDNRILYIREAEKLQGLRRIPLQTSEIAVFENSASRPHLYLTKEEESLEVPVAFTPIDFQHIRPTEYRIQLRQIREPVYLHFVETFHPDWELRPGTFRWVDVLSSPQYALPQSLHGKSSAEFNVYKIDPQEVCSDYTCQKNEDGSYDIDLTLYFKPQVYLFIGAVISGAVLLLTCGYVLYYVIKKTKEK